MQLPERKPKQDLYGYRVHVAKILGFDEQAADFLAATDADLKRIAALLDNGCPHELAIRIVL